MDNTMPTVYPKIVSLTFDDGPHRKCTDKIVDILEKYDVKSTFFEHGKRVKRRPEIARRVYEAGHEIGNHSYRHKKFINVPVETVLKDLAKADEVFKAIGIPVPSLFRPPAGETSVVMKCCLEKAIIKWSLDTRDWESRNVKEIIEKVQEPDDLSGHIILMHDAFESTVNAVNEIVPWLLDEGYKIVPVTKLLETCYDESPKQGVLYGWAYFRGKGII